MMPSSLNCHLAGGGGGAGGSATIGRTGRSPIASCVARRRSMMSALNGSAMDHPRDHHDAEPEGGADGKGPSVTGAEVEDGLGGHDVLPVSGHAWFPTAVSPAGRDEADSR